MGFGMVQLATKVRIIFVILLSMRIYLIGYMASGKSNLGQLLASAMGYVFVDLDYLFEERYRISVLDFFEKYDEESFRKIEQQLLHETISMENTVISTGGGTPCFYDNMDFIKSAGISVYLHWELDPLVVRLRNVRIKRPLLKNITPGELESKVKAHIGERETYYLRADYIFEAEKEEMGELVARLIARSDHH